jgi:dihydroflavonol-4-reductase
VCKNPDAMFHINIEGTKKMLDLGNKLGIKKFIYTSSAVTLGEGKGLPGNEEAIHRGSFLSNYEKSKYEAEVEAFKFKKILSSSQLTHHQFKDQAVFREQQNYLSHR